MNALQLMLNNIGLQKIALNFFNTFRCAIYYVWEKYKNIGVFRFKMDKTTKITTINSQHHNFMEHGIDRHLKLL